MLSKPGSVRNSNAGGRVVDERTQTLGCRLLLPLYTVGMTRQPWPRGLRCTTRANRSTRSTENMAPSPHRPSARRESSPGALLQSRPPERWMSGLSHTPGKRAWGKTHRGFESRPLRQIWHSRPPCTTEPDAPESPAGRVPRGFPFFRRSASCTAAPAVRTAGGFGRRGGSGSKAARKKAPHRGASCWSRKRWISGSRPVRCACRPCRSSGSGRRS